MKNKRYYLAGPINGFLNEIWNPEKETKKQFLFRNWDAALEWGFQKVLELYKLGIDKVYCPHMYTIPFAKKHYDEIGDDREYWMKLDTFFLESMLAGDGNSFRAKCINPKCNVFEKNYASCSDSCHVCGEIHEFLHWTRQYDSKLVMLLSDTAYIKPHTNPKLAKEGFEILSWNSKGSEIEYNWAIDHFVEVKDLKTFLNELEM